MYLRHETVLLLSMATLSSLGCGVNVHPLASSSTPPSSPISSSSPQSIVPPPVPAPLTPVVVSGTKRSIRDWAVCDGVTDDNRALGQALAAAKNHAFILEIDCPLFVHVGEDPTRPLFIDNGTQIDFSPNGLIILDNSLIPSFLIADTQDITLTNWNIEYQGALSIDEMGVDGSNPAWTFNINRFENWLIENRNITFAANMQPYFPGNSDESAIFFIAGNSSGVYVEDMNVWVPQSAGSDHFVPMVFALAVLETPDHSVTRDTPFGLPYFSIPSNLSFSGLRFDGTYFGFQGSAQNVLIHDVVSLRYSDLQDANGGNIGGKGLWFAPPHLFYLNYNTNGDPSLFNENIVIKDVLDYGQRSGNTRTTSSGNCYSLKLGTIHGTVSNYMSFRPDGFMDVLPSTDLTLTKVAASYDSSFLNGTYPLIRFPAGGYHQVAFSDVRLQDTSSGTIDAPIWGNSDTSNTDITIDTTSAQINQWTGTKPPQDPSFAGTGNHVDITYSYQ